MEPKSQDLLQALYDCLMVNYSEDRVDCLSIKDQAKAIETYFRIQLYLEHTKREEFENERWP